MTFDEYYYLYYLPKHTSKWTKLFHMLGVLATIVWLAYALTQTGGWTLAAMLCAAPFVVYPFAHLSHFLFEAGEGKMPASLTSNPLWAKVANFRMCWDLLTRKIDWQD